MCFLYELKVKRKACIWVNRLDKIGFHWEELELKVDELVESHCNPLIIGHDC